MPEAFFRWLALLGAATLFGAPLFRALAGAETPAPRAAARPRAPAEALLAARLIPLARAAVWAAVGLLFAGRLGQVVVQSLRLGGLTDLPQVLLDTRVGTLALARLLPALAALWVTLHLPFAERWQPRARLARRLALVAAALFGLLLVWAAAQGGYWVTLAWVGVTTGAWLLWRERAQADPAARPAVWKLARRYSYLASFAIFLLALTGLVNSLVQIPDLPSLWTTAYGRVLLLKLGVPASAYAPQPPFNTTLSADDLSIHAQITPNTVGDNRFWLHLYHAAGDTVGEVQLVELRFNYLQAQLGQSTVDLTPLGRATFETTGAYLSQAGPWEVYIRRRGLDDVLTTFVEQVPAFGEVLTADERWHILNFIRTLVPPE